MQSVPSWPKTKKHQPDLISIQQDTVLRTWSWSPSREWDLLTILTPASVVRSIGSTGIKLWHSEPISKNRASSTRGTCMDISELPYANCNLKFFSPPIGLFPMWHIPNVAYSHYQQFPQLYFPTPIFLTLLPHPIYVDMSADFHLMIQSQKTIHPLKRHQVMWKY